MAVEVFKAPHPNNVLLTCEEYAIPGAGYAILADGRMAYQSHFGMPFSRQRTGFLRRDL